MKRFKLKSSLLSLLTIVLIALAFSSCLKEDNYYEKQAAADDQKISQHLTDNSITATKHSSGFHYQVLTANSTGETLNEGDVVGFYYKISLLDGTVLDEYTTEDGEPVLFKLMNSTIVPIGLDDGINLMKVGETARFFMPSYLAYGSYASADFPANSNFIIDVQVANTQTEAEVNTAQIDSIQQFVDSQYPDFVKSATGMFFIDSIPGTGSMPLSGDRVTIGFKRKYLDGTLIKSTDVYFYLDNNAAVKGLEEGIKLMRAGGKANIIIPSSLGFQESLCVIPLETRTEMLYDGVITSEVLPYSIIQYSVDLKSVY